MTRLAYQILHPDDIDVIGATRDEQVFFYQNRQTGQGLELYINELDCDNVANHSLDRVMS